MFFNFAQKYIPLHELQYVKDIDKRAMHISWKPINIRSYMWLQSVQLD